jgi:hypothetical protein
MNCEDEYFSNKQKRNGGEIVCKGGERVILRGT